MELNKTIPRNTLLFMSFANLALCATHASQVEDMKEEPRPASVASSPPSAQSAPLVAQMQQHMEALYQETTNAHHLILAQNQVIEASQNDLHAANHRINQLEQRRQVAQYRAIIAEKEQTINKLQQELLTAQKNHHATTTQYHAALIDREQKIRGLHQALTTAHQRISYLKQSEQEALNRQKNIDQLEQRLEEMSIRLKKVEKQSKQNLAESNAHFVVRVKTQAAHIANKKNKTSAEN